MPKLYNQVCSNVDHLASKDPGWCSQSQGLSSSYPARRTKKQAFSRREFARLICEFLPINASTVGKIPMIIIDIQGCLSLSLVPHKITFSAISWGPWADTPWMSFTPQWITPTLVVTGRNIFSTRHKTFCVRSPPIPQFTAWRGYKCSSHTAGHRERFATRESPSKMTLACSATVLLNDFLWSPYHVGFVLSTGRGILEFSNFG